LWDYNDAILTVPENQAYEVPYSGHLHAALQGHYEFEDSIAYQL